ncbi:phospholipid-binding protein, PBP family [Nitrosospira multiformis]|uniref:Phospholipid-binding protein, PBP family n=2 Tax=Nitrosospira multiformis TaxID=1231 RepID=A0A1I0EU35_9PROT|nr:phospholipid-binding protein, PBP family [Nitrosospira multiformis]
MIRWHFPFQRRRALPKIMLIRLLAGVMTTMLAASISVATEPDILLSQKERKPKKEASRMSMTITSSSFANHGEIPIRHTCQGHDNSPELFWDNIPENAKSLVLIVDDPDAPDPAAPKLTWVHWVLYNIPPAAQGLPEGVAEADLPIGTLGGLNDWQRTGYGGPCPPIGKHRYFHKLYALDIMLPDLKHPTKAILEQEMKGHVIAQSELVGLYQKQ